MLIGYDRETVDGMLDARMTGLEAPVLNETTSERTGTKPEKVQAR